MRRFHLTSIAVLVVLLSSTTLLGQHKQDYVWITGYDFEDEDGRQVVNVDFNDGKPNFTLKERLMSFDQNNGIICDSEGHLLLYFNGCMVANGDDLLVTNGDSINSGTFQDDFWPDCQRNGYPGRQDVMILPDPNGLDIFYILHKKVIIVPNDPILLELQYTLVDRSLGSRGIAIEKNVFLHPNKNLLGGYFTAIANDQNDGWWMIQPIAEDSLFLTFLINKDGISTMQDQNTHQYFDRFRSSSSGTARFSPDGLHYALYNYYDQLHLYDFDRSTGLLSNHQKIEIFPDAEIDRGTIRIGSVEWSPDSRFVYCASSLELHQVDMWEEDPQDGVRHIATYEEYLDPFQTSIGLQVLGPDCKIYIAPGNGSASYHVINKPNEIGTACDFVQNGIKLPGYAARSSLPNHPRFRVDEEDKCDPTITSVFGEAVYYRRSLQVYPNPSTGPITVVVPAQLGKGELVVFDVQGQVVYSLQLPHGTLTQQLDLSFLPSGHYNVELYPSDNEERVFYGEQVVLQR